MQKEENILTDYVWNFDIYGALMSGNIAMPDFDGDKKQISIELIQKMIREKDDEFIDELLRIENWRGRTTAGFLIGFKNKKKYIPKIGRLFLYGCGGVTGYIYAFAKIADEESIGFFNSVFK